MDSDKPAPRPKQLITTESVLKGDEYKRFINTQDSINFISDSGSFFFLFVDLTNMSCQYVSPSITSILGYSASLFMDNGVEFIYSLYHSDSVLTQRAIHEEVTRFLSFKTIKDRVNYHFIFDLYLKHANGSFVRLLQHNKILKYDKAGNPLLIYIQCQNINDYCDQHKQTVIITKVIKGSEKVVFKKEFFPYYENKILTSKETAVWRYISDGLSSKDIAVKLNISLNTVLTHRKRIYKKIKIHNN